MDNEALAAKRLAKYPTSQSRRALNAALQGVGLAYLQRPHKKFVRKGKKRHIRDSTLNGSIDVQITPLSQTTRSHYNRYSSTKARKRTSQHQPLLSSHDMKDATHKSSNNEPVVVLILDLTHPSTHKPQRHGHCSEDEEEDVGGE